MKFFRKHQKKLIAALALLLALLMILPAITMIMGSAGAVTQAEIDKLKKDAAALDEKKEELNKQLEKLAGEINGELSKKMVVEQEIMVVEGQINNTEALISQYEVLIKHEEANLAQAQNDEATHYDEFCRRVRAMEEEGTTTYWHIIFNAASFTDLLDKAMMISEVVEYDNAVMDSLEQARIDVETAKAALESAKEEQVSAKLALSAQRAELSAKEATIEGLLAEMEKKQDVYEDQIHELDEQAAEMDKEIAKKQKELEKQLEANKVKIDAGSGYLWPLKNCFVITSFFGTRTDPFTGKPGNHGGTDIRANGGTPIMAARGGVIMTSEYHNSYGNYVVVYHGNGESTLYAHMSKRNAKVGATVKQGDVIGYVGTTGRSNGNHLHFEVRINNVRVDALNYYKNVTFYNKKGQAFKP